MRSTTNLLIINLAAADILFVIFCVPFTATDYIFPEWPFGDYWCKYVSAYFCSFCLGSLFSISFFYAGTIHDSGDLPCECLHFSINVV